MYFLLLANLLLHKLLLRSTFKCPLDMYSLCFRFTSFGVMWMNTAMFWIAYRLLVVLKHFPGGAVWHQHKRPLQLARLTCIKVILRKQYKNGWMNTHTKKMCQAGIAEIF